MIDSNTDLDETESPGAVLKWKAIQTVAFNSNLTPEEQNTIIDEIFHATGWTVHHVLHRNEIVIEEDKFDERHNYIRNPSERSQRAG